MPAAKSKYPRRYMAEIGFASSAVSLCSMIWESSYLMLKRPDQPDDVAGLVYPFKIKGPEVYISAADANCVSLCLIFLILSFGCIAYAVGSKSAAADITLNDNGSFGVGNRSGSFSIRLFLISIIVVAGVFLVFGRWIADYLAAHGMILHLYSQDLRRRS